MSSPGLDKEDERETNRLTFRRSSLFLWDQEAAPGAPGTNEGKQLGSALESPPEGLRLRQACGSRRGPTTKGATEKNEKEVRNGDLQPFVSVCAIM